MAVKNRSRQKSITVAAKAKLDDAFHVGFDALRASQLANPLGGLANRKVARPRFAVLGLPGCSQSESLLRSLMCFLFRHNILSFGARYPTLEENHNLV